MEAEHLIAVKGCESDAVVAQATQQGMRPQIPPRKNRKTQRDDDTHRHKLRHMAENAILHLKQWRGIATRHATRADSFLAALHIRCIVSWTNIS